MAKTQIQVEVTYPRRTETMAFVIVPAMVLCGGYWLDGVQPLELTMDSESIAYAINENRAVEGQWNDVDIDPENADAIVSWRVSPEGVSLLRQHGIVEPDPEFQRLVLHLGLGFHPDTRGCDYVDNEGRRVFAFQRAPRGPTTRATQTLRLATSTCWLSSPWGAD